MGAVKGRMGEGELGREFRTSKSLSWRHCSTTRALSPWKKMGSVYTSISAYCTDGVVYSRYRSTSRVCAPTSVVPSSNVSPGIRRPPSFSTEATFVALRPWNETSHLSKMPRMFARGGSSMPNPVKPCGIS